MACLCSKIWSMKILSISILSLFATLPVHAATVYETDGTLEREPFPYVTTSLESTSAADSTDDLYVFDRQGRKTLPPVLADLTGMSIEPQEEGWLVTFQIAEPLPEDPGLAVNFDVFIDSDENEANNATTGVYRVGSDTIFMILHGTRTKWHSKWWKYNPGNGRWAEQDDKPVFSIGDGEYTLTIPYDVIAKEEGVKMRGFSLTSTGGITAIDVAPGKGLPAVLATPEPEVNDVAPTPAESDTPPNKGAIALIVILVVTALLAWKSKKN